MQQLTFYPQFLSVDGPVCEHGSTRLEGDDSEEEGVVQVCFRGLWGSIISQSWGFSESRVACRSLGRDEYGEQHIHAYIQHGPIVHKFNVCGKLCY